MHRYPNCLKSPLAFRIGCESPANYFRYKTADVETIYRLSIIFTALQVVFVRVRLVSLSLDLSHEKKVQVVCVAEEHKRR